MSGQLIPLKPAEVADLIGQKRAVLVDIRELALAGVTGFRGMAKLLAPAPWNRFARS
jgi:hypothetical protein